MIDIDISDAISHPGNVYSFSFEGRPSFEGVTLAGPVNVNGSYEIEDGIVRVEGNINARIEGKCSRCLKDTITVLCEPFSEVLSERADDDSYTFSQESKTMILDEIVRDVLIASVPIRMLCREDCKGICSKCGADLNLEECGCDDSRSPEGEVINSPFSLLKDLF